MTHLGPTVVAMLFFAPEDLRVSDAERDDAVDFLNRHYAAGRLTESEHSARVDAAYRARWDSDLDALMADLPPLPPTTLARRDGVGRRVGPVAGLAALGVGGVAAASVIPPEAWAMLITLGLPLVLMLLFTVAPIAVPVLALAWLVRGFAGPVRQELPRRHPRG